LSANISFRPFNKWFEMTRRPTSKPPPRPFKTVIAFAVLIAASAGLRAAELPSLHPPPKKPAPPAAGVPGGFDIAGTGLRVTFGGYIEGAAIMTNSKSGAIPAGPPGRLRKPTP
jgi:hypothetical protein